MAKRKKQAKQHKRQASKRKQTVTLDISAMAHGGHGIGKLRGKAVFIPYTLPGETVSAEISGGRGAALFGRGRRLIAASADRVPPQCQHFGPGRCWGCQWQHIAYPAQLLLKQDVLADQLARLGKLPDALIEATLRPVLPAPKHWAYKHSLRLTRTANGEWGLRREAGGIEPIDDCPVTQPDLLDLLAEIDLDYGPARHLTARRGSDGRLLLIFEVDAEEAPQLHTDLPVSVNLILADREPVNLIGDAHSNFTIGGRQFRVTAGAYMRQNIDGIAALVAEVMRALRLTGSERVLDLYAGGGIFSAFMAAQATLVTLVESYPPAVTDAEVNLQEYANIDIVEGAVEAVLADMAAETARYDVALVDPPRAGLKKAAIDGLARLDVARLVYVSDNPASLARDSRQLLAAGFSLCEIQPIDLAPQTYYLSAVARYER